MADLPKLEPEGEESPERAALRAPIASTDGIRKRETHKKQLSIVEPHDVLDKREDSGGQWVAWSTARETEPPQSSQENDSDDQSSSEEEERELTWSEWIRGHIISCLFPPEEEAIFGTHQHAVSEDAGLWNRLARARFHFVNALRSAATYYRAHLSLFILGCLLSGLILFAMEGAKYPFIDTLYVATSALSACGLSSLPVANLHPVSQVFLMLLTILGGQTFLSLPLVFLRRYRFKNFVRRESEHHTHYKLHMSNGVRVRVRAKASDILHERTLLEYRALNKIIMLVLAYIAGVLLVCVLALIIYFYASDGTEVQGVPSYWAAIFHTVVSFNNVGFSLFADSFTTFTDKYQWIPTIIFTFTVTLGNTWFPVALRFLVFCIHRIKEKGRESRDVQVYKYILTNPRRCYTHLFPAYATKVLAVTLLAMLVGEWLLFVVLDWNEPVLDGLSPGQKLLAGWFQSVSTRSAGFQTVDLNQLHPATIVLYTASMYLASYPLFLAIRSSNVASDSDVFIKKRVRNTAMQLVLRDAAWVYVGWLLVCLMENPASAEVYPSLFEIVSAYGTVGLSLGTASDPFTALSASWGVPAKLVLIWIMIMGRHRGLPDTVDRAVQLPAELHVLTETEEEEENPHPPDLMPSPGISRVASNTDLVGAAAGKPSAFSRARLNDRLEVLKEDQEAS